MDITQTFYDNLASQYEKLFLDWQAAIRSITNQLADGGMFVASIRD